VFRFYALDIGLGFATYIAHTVTSTIRPKCFYALDIGLGFATDALWRPS
jgi:hypothetical protein